jgi:hypothetical protein
MLATVPKNGRIIEEKKWEKKKINNKFKNNKKNVASASLTVAGSLRAQEFLPC